MPNFVVKDVSPGRFEGDFAIETDSGHSPSASEQAYLDKLKEPQTQLGGRLAAG